MSAEKQKISCSVCHAYLFDEDDVVYCPECGAPHHRECYSKIGHCALEEFHGTEQQYDKIREKEKENLEKKAECDSQNSKFHDTITCPKCESTYPAIMSRCPRCGTFNSQNEKPFGASPFVMFDLLGGIPKDMDLGDGVTADEAKQFVVSNTPRYIPKFAAMKIGSKVSWNWLGFLFPSAWYMSRKMYLKGILVTVLLVAFSLLSIPLLNSVSYGDMSSAQNFYATQNLVATAMENAEIPHLILAAAGFIFELVLRIITGLLGDWHYRNHTLNTISEIKSNSDNIAEDIRKKGGVSFLGLIIGFFAVQYLPTLISYFFNLV